MYTSLKSALLSWRDGAVALDHAVLSLAALCAALALLLPQPSTAAETDHVMSRSVLVDKSLEPIPEKLTIETVPQTLSLDAFTDQEIKDLTQELQANACAAWMFRKQGAELKLVGVQAEGSYGVVKLNGAMRSAIVTSGLYVSQFDIIRSLADSTNMGKGPIIRAGVRLIGSSSRLVSKRDTRCTYAKARCRHYEFDETHFVWYDDKDIGKLYPTEYSVSSQTKSIFRLIVEDYCPATDGGAVEQSKIERMGQRGNNMSRLIYGISGNPPLGVALGGKSKK